MMNPALVPVAFVAYYRVSTKGQGVSGLGLEAQRAAVAAYVAQHAGAVLGGEFTEVESGRKVRRPQLTLALEEARQRHAVLVIAKLDRLARNVAFLSALMEGDVEFRALDLPGASKFHLHIMAAVAEQEADAISARTKAALSALKARGVKLGTPANLTDEARRRSLASRRTAAEARDRQATSAAWYMRLAGLTLQAVADELTQLRVPTPRRCRAVWEPAQVHRMLARIPDGPHVAACV